MDTKNGNTFKRNWFLITDKVREFEEVSEDYDYPISRYDPVAIGPKDWDTKSSYEAAGFRILSTRRELVELMKDFKETYPDANITVMKS